MVEFLKNYPHCLHASVVVELVPVVKILQDLISMVRLQGEYIEAESVGPTFIMGGVLELPGSEIVSKEEDESDDEILYRRTVSL
ncbi:transcription termination factor MTERF4, chloroplastic [Olea europaea subsp. europaea]|uniref:Transcription termination factor MTERF4, chloroplastic n=1 Tax=Olea europaea subsp. europaea TaxID=158383 RepID=A0A8S0SCV7_OLEEU|nr:transcription termination factor MTERF4, chloroplastic [Olea europaea subsp. europaea]